MGDHLYATMGFAKQGGPGRHLYGSAVLPPSEFFPNSPSRRPRAIGAALVRWPSFLAPTKLLPAVGLSNLKR